jgi:Uma2 family endonuclease
MTLAIDEAFLPATLTSRPMTDEEFSALWAEHPDLHFEMTAEGELIAIAPAHCETGARSGEVFGELRDWTKRHRNGMCFDSSTGFVLPNGARRSPDASWVSRARLRPKSATSSFWHVCPDFGVEVRSDSDRLKPLQRKMREYIEQGAQLGWLIDSDKRSVTIYRPNGDVETRIGVDRVEGEGPVAGFVLDLTCVWDPRAHLDSLS